MMMIFFGLWEKQTLQGKGMWGLRTTGVPGWPNLPWGDAGYPGARRVSLFGSGHEAVLDAEHDEGVLAAAGLLLQQLPGAQGGSLPSGCVLLCPPCLTVALGQAPALGI